MTNSLLSKKRFFEEEIDKSNSLLNRQEIIDISQNDKKIIYSEINNYLYAAKLPKMSFDILEKIYLSLFNDLICPQKIICDYNYITGGYKSKHYDNSSFLSKFDQEDYFFQGIIIKLTCNKSNTIVLNKDLICEAYSFIPKHIAYTNNFPRVTSVFSTNKNFENPTLNTKKLGDENNTFRYILIPIFGYSLFHSKCMFEKMSLYTSYLNKYLYSNNIKKTSDFLRSMINSKLDLEKYYGETSDDSIILYKHLNKHYYAYFATSGVLFDTMSSFKNENIIYNYKINA